MKKIVAILTVCVLMISMMGFTPNQSELFGETQKVSKWNAVESTGSMTVRFPYMDSSIKSVSMDYSSITDNKNMKSQITFSNLKFPSNRTYAPLKMYFDKNTFYYDMNMAVVAASEFMNEDAGKYVEVKDSYLGYTVDIEKMLSMPMYKDLYSYNSLLKIANNPQALLESYDKFFASNAEIALDVKKEGSKYIIDSNLYEFAKVGNVFLKQLKLASDKEIADFDAALEESKEEMKQVVIKYTVEFSEDSYKGTLKMSSPEDSYLYGGFSLDVSFNGVKKESVLIALPQSYIKFNFNEIIQKVEEETKTNNLPEADVTAYEPEKPFMSIKLDGSFVKGDQKGKLNYKNIYGNMYIKKSDLEKQLDTIIESAQEYVYVGIIDESGGYYSSWNQENKAIEIFKY